MRRIVFNRPHVVGTEFEHIRRAIENGHLSGNGPFAERCHRWLETRTGTRRALLTHSCTAALEMAMLLLDVGPGDEVIVPSFTFVSTANAVVLRGATPVFVDIREDTLNMDDRLLEEAITERTRAIVPVHYSGVACEMEAVGAVARRCGASVVEDAAQGLGASFRGRALGSIGTIGALSFHETKNVTCGEGGALLINDECLVARAEILHEKGTNRREFFRNEVDKYTWVDVGSSFAPSEINAAFLWAQFEREESITARRLDVWHRYHEGLAGLEDEGLARRPIVPDGRQHNGHLFFLLMRDRELRDTTLSELAKRGIHAVFHYVPLHSSPAGMRYGRPGTSMSVTDDASSRLLRLPVWPDLRDADVEEIAETVVSVCERAGAAGRTV